jgi:hypothetical protein
VSIWHSLFSRKSKVGQKQVGNNNKPSQSPYKMDSAKGEVKTPVAKTFTEKDNLGSRHDTYSQASSYWMARITSPKKDPFTMFIFDDADSARKALLELPCINLAEDSHQLICTEVLIFGYYPVDGGKFEALICGDDLTHELWEQARTSFARYGGRCKNELEPEKHLLRTQSQQVTWTGDVVFIREDRKQSMGKTMIYRIYKGTNASSAQAFLRQHPVDKQFLYIVVETPEGNYCRDIQGMYKE